MQVRVIDRDGAALPTAGTAAEPEPTPSGDWPARGLLSDIAVELQWTLRERKGWFIGIGFNLILAGIYVGYTHYQPNRPDDVRVAGIATGVALWVLADVINTNQLGDDGARVAALLAEGHGVGRQIARKNGALACILLPLTVLISVGVRLALDRWRAIPHAVLLDLFVVFTWLGVGDVISVLLPYRPISLRSRWHLRRSWPRWLLCLLAPYLALPVINQLRWPADRLAHVLLGSPDRHLLGFAFLYMCWGVVLWGAGIGIAALYGRRAPRRLESELNRAT
jgi:hypothetical protein